MGTERGGCEHDALCLMRQVSTWRHHVLVLGESGPMSAEFAKAGADVEHARVQTSRSLSMVAAVRAVVLQQGPQGVIAWHGMVALPEILHALCDFPGRVLVHGGNPAHSLPRWVDWRYWLREKWLGHRCDATYVCCSQYVADSFERSCYLRRFPRVVVYNGVKPLTVPPHVPRQIAHGEPFTIGMTARLDHIKDHPTLLRAFALVLKEWPAARLELAGDGDRRAQLERLAGELGIAERVKFLGMVSDVYAVMQHWDIFAYATTDREGLGNALAEAMLLGLPCIVTDVGPMREIVGESICAVFIPKGNTQYLAVNIVRLANDFQLRNQLSTKASAHMQLKYSSKSFAESYLLMLNHPIAS